MRKLFLLFLFISIWCSNILAVEGFREWDGLWGKTYDDDRSLTSEIPFYSDYWEDFIVVHNEKPDRAIFYEIVDEYDNILIKGSVSKENSAQITISVSDLPDNGIYTIILTSPDPNDWVYSKFKK